MSRKVDVADVPQVLYTYNYTLQKFSLPGHYEDHKAGTNHKTVSYCRHGLILSIEKPLPQLRIIYFMQRICIFFLFGEPCLLLYSEGRPQSLISKITMISLISTTSQSIVLLHCYFDRGSVFYITRHCYWLHYWGTTKIEICYQACIYSYDLSNQTTSS